MGLNSLKNVSILTLGNVFSQLINIVFFIFLARVYEPSEFGIFAILMGLSAILGVISAFRYEVTILLPKVDQHAKLALVGSITLSVVSVLAVGTVLFAASLFELAEWLVYWYVVPVAALANAMVSIVSYYQNRRGFYVSLVLIQISKTFCIGFVAILFSYSSFEDGLVLALFVSSLIVVIGMFLACTFLQLGDANAFSLSRHRIWLRKYIEFPLFTTPAVFFSATAQHSPVFIFGALWGDHSAGLYSMVNRLILAPVRLVASAVNKVYLRKVARLRACGIGIYLYTYKLVSKLFLFSFLVTIIAICVLMLDGVSLVLGANWAEADLLALAVLPVFFVGFVSKSVVSFAVIGANKLGFAYQFLLFFTVLFSLSLAYAAGFDLHASIVSLSVSLAFVYLMQIRSILHESKRVSEKC